MNVIEKALEFVCPVCDAQPREECHRIDGVTMPHSHTARRNLVLGVRPRNRREDVNQAAAWVVKQANERE